MEILGSESRAVHMTARLLEQGQHVQHGREWRGPEFSAGFHEFALEWHPDRLVWFVDGVERHRYSGLTPRTPMYMLANLAVGGEWAGEPDAATRFPARFEIDHVRAWHAG
jgi:beta-glucanase (GH16 family)